MTRAVSDFLSAYLTYVEGHEGLPLVHYSSALSVLSAVLERKVWLDRGYFTLYPNTYFIIVGDPGTKKTSSANIAVDLLKEISDMCLLEECLTPASLIDTLSNSERYFTYDKKQVPHSTVYAYAPELATFLEDIGGGTLTTLLTAFYDSGPSDPNMPWTKKTKGGGLIEIKAPQLSILGCTTKEWLVRALPLDAIGGGFTSRILFCVVDAIPEPKAYPEPADPTLKQKLITTLKHIHTLTGPIKETKRAREVYKEWYDSFMINELPQVPDERFKGYAARKGDHIIKLAILFSVAERDDLILTEKDYGKAVVFLRTLEQSMFKAFGSKGKNVYAEDIERLYRQIPFEPKTITYKELLLMNWRHTNMIEFKAVLETLFQAGAIGSETKGKDTFYWRVKDVDITACTRNLQKVAMSLSNDLKLDSRIFK